MMVAGRPAFRRHGAAACAVILAILTAAGCDSATTAQVLAYRTLPGPCRLLTASTAVRYVPGATASATLASVPGNDIASATLASVRGTGRAQGTSCTWESFAGHQDRMLFVTVLLFNGPSGVAEARRQFGRGTQPPSGVTMTSRSVAGVDDQVAALTFHDGPQMDDTTMLLVRSGNAIAGIIYSDNQVMGTLQLATLADQIAIARDVLTVLSRPATAAPVTLSAPQGPRYGQPSRACRLAAPATLSRYLPGATADAHIPDTPSGGMASCYWDTQGYSTLSVQVIIYDSALGGLGPQAGYEFWVQNGEVSAVGDTVVRTEPVRGVGDQATAIYLADSQTSTKGVTLVTWLGNAVVQVTYQVGTNTGAPRYVQLAAAIAFTRDALARLPSAG